MNIVLGRERVQDLVGKYVVLALDSFQVPGHQEPVVSYCVVENTPISDLKNLDNLINLHEKLIANYHKKNWNFCEQALEHLMGRWNGELDSFYRDLSGRVSKYRDQDPGPEWTGVIVR